MDLFKYNPLDLEQNAFRLVRLQGGFGEDIECELIHTTLDENVIPYEAVSYAWGSTTKTDIIYIQGAGLSITRNLSLILHDLRYLVADRYLWIDAICINQDNVHERGHQVRQMKHIYSGADRVLFCIGRSTEMTQDLMSSLAELQRLTRGNNWDREDPRWKVIWDMVHENTNTKRPGTLDRQRQGLEYILKQPWFLRVWILQEVANAKAASVYCGRDSILSRIFAVSPQLLGVKPNSHCQAVIDLMPGPSRNQHGQHKDRDLRSLLLKFSQAKAQDDRDRIYALLGLCTDSEHSRSIIPDYEKSIEGVIRQAISHIYFIDIESLPETAYPISMDFFFISSPTIDRDIFSGLKKSRDFVSLYWFLEYYGRCLEISKTNCDLLSKSELVRIQSLYFHILTLILSEAPGC